MRQSPSGFGCGAGGEARGVVGCQFEPESRPAGTNARPPRERIPRNPPKMAAKIERSINHSLRELEPRRGEQPGRRLRVRTGSLKVLAGFSLAESALEHKPGKQITTRKGKENLDSRDSRESAVRIAQVSPGLPFALGSVGFLALVLRDFLFGVGRSEERRVGKECRSRGGR